MNRLSRLFFVPLLLVCQQGLMAQDVRYRSAQNSWDPDSLGNHRAVVHVNRTGPAAKVVIPWRRRDNPAGKAVIVVDARTGKRIPNVSTANISRESGTVYFKPVSGVGNYYIYYMPYQVTARSNYPQAVYRQQHNTAAPVSNAVTATLQYLESVNDMNSFYPMEVIATAKETAAIIKAGNSKAYLVFPEDREHPVKMRHDLPQRWIKKGLTDGFTAPVSRGEHFAYQLAIYPVKGDIKGVTVHFSDFKDAAGHTIPAGFMSCLNTTGVRYDGSPFQQVVNVNKGEVQPMWCLANLPEQTAAGSYTGTATVKAAGQAATVIRINLQVQPSIAAGGGTDSPEKMTRLTWLNSTLAQANEVIAPYTPLTVTDKTISLLGRRVTVNNNGFPEQIQTFFTPEMTELGNTPRNVLAENIHFHVTDAATHKDITFKNEQFAFATQENTAGKVRWQATNTSASLKMEVDAFVEFDGYLYYKVKFTALQDVNLDDIKLHIPFDKSVGKYVMGLGQKGGLRPDTVNWKWDVAAKNQDGAWVGDVNAGLQYSLRDEHYVRPLNTNFYLQKPLLLPTSWGNSGKGGIWMAVKGSSMLSENYSGPRSMKKGEELYYNFTMLITPFHTINTDFQWATRFYHKYDQLNAIKATGATVVNIHHGNAINPYINYPFIARKAMKSYIDSAHGLGLKVKIYNTVRELSNSAYETFAMRSLGHEIYSPGKGGGYSWLQEHVGDDYIAAWYVPEIKDAAIVNSGMSRWHNYYVEGMNWLVQNIGIDGIYLDDVAFDRITMKRIKRVLTQNGHPGIIDLHSANQYNKSDGFNNSANLYMEHFPYLNRLWFGEYFDYEKNSPDFFLTEVSGIPFGLMGEMLQDGGNAWRGMVYGMTNRMPWSDNADPRPLWKAWDDFGMQGTKMIGYWVANNPVKTNNDSVLATVYKKDGKAMIAIASWAPADVNVTLNIDWKSLGIDAAKATLTAPAITNFQPAQQWNATAAIPVQKGKGWLLVLK